jgi:transposase InsO family protein
VQHLCELLNVSRSGYYRWRQKRPTQRQRDDTQLAAQIAAAHQASRGSYGAPRVVEELRDQGVHTSRRRCARLMRQEGLRGRKNCRRRPRTTDSRHQRPVVENRLPKCSALTGPNQAWITDITYIRTAEGWLYLAAILDAWSRRVVGWTCAATLHVELALAALLSAIRERRPARGLLHHSDRGVQYACETYVGVLHHHGLVQSMSRAGHCGDNATMESFWSTVKTETGLEQWIPSTRRHAELAVFDYIETFYNPTRRHSSLGYLSPVVFENQHTHNDTKAA